MADRGAMFAAFEVSIASFVLIDMISVLPSAGVNESEMRMDIRKSVSGLGRLSVSPKFPFYRTGWIWTGLRLMTYPTSLL